MKAHRRSGSGVEDGDLDIDNMPQKFGNTPYSSPKMSLAGEFTPPQNRSNALTLGSPKKLLTPIKNFLTGHGKPLQTISSGDMLNEAIFGDESKQGSSKHRRRRRKQDNKTSESIDKKKQNIESQTKRSSLLGPGFELPTSRNNKNGMIHEKNPRSQVTSNAYRPAGLQPKTNLSPSRYTNSSDQSARTSQEKDRHSEVTNPSERAKIADNSNRTLHDIKHKDQTKSQTNDDDYYYDDLDSDSDSSQFSFVRDRTAGRNTSVKYYKTKPSKSSKIDGNINIFNENDLGYEVDELLDYDFENNGILDQLDDDLDGDLEEDVQYNPLFDEEDANVDTTQRKLNDIPKPVISPSLNNDFAESSPVSSIIFDKEDTDTASTDIKFTQSMIRGIKPYNHSYHLSINGLDPSTTSDSERFRSSDYLKEEEDILENYLDPKLLSSHVSLRNKSITPDVENGYSSSDSSPEVVDVNPPLVNGLTVGTNLRHRISKFQSNIDVTDTDTSKLFINRLPSIPTKSSKMFLERERLDKMGTEVFRNRPLRSFHGSISDNLNITLAAKVEEMSLFSDRHNFDASNSKKSIEDNISDEKELRMANMTEDQSIDNDTLQSHTSSGERTSIIQMMGILESLENRQETNSQHDSNLTETKQASNPTVAENRSSIAHMMGLLKSLEEKEEINSNVKDSTSDEASLETPSSLDQATLHLKKLPGQTTLPGNLSKDASDDRQRFSQASLASHSGDHLMNLLQSIEENQNCIPSQSNEVRSRIESSSPEIKISAGSMDEVVETLSALEKCNIYDSDYSNMSSPNDIQLVIDDVDSSPTEESHYLNVPLGGSRQNRKGQLAELQNEEKNNKRYSWFSNDEVFTFRTHNALQTETDNTNDRKQKEIPVKRNSKDVNYEDLIAEANQLPIDDDFEELVMRSKSAPSHSAGFHATKSFSRRPTKAVNDLSYSSSKIVTRNKTVTFYRSNSYDNSSGTGRNKLLSRALSSKSQRSLESITDENETWEDTSNNLSVSNGPYSFRSNTPLNSLSTESFRKSSPFLGTISENENNSR